MNSRSTCLAAWVPILLLLLSPAVGRAQSGTFTPMPTNGSPSPQANAQPAATTSAPAAGGTADDGPGLTIMPSVELGWRWMPLGQTNIPRVEDSFQMGYHGALGLDIGGTGGGLYTYARFDGFAPTGYGTFPWMAQVRVGFFTNVHYFDAGGPRSSTSTSYTGTSCYGDTCYDHYNQRTTNWLEPAGWVNGLRYFYAGGRLISGTRVATDSRDTQMAAAVSLGAGMIETKFSTWFAEMELLYFPGSQWQEPDRSDWGFYMRGGALLGPVFLDCTLLLDPAIGGELSLGAGIWLGG